MPIVSIGIDIIFYIICAICQSRSSNILIVKVTYRDMTLEAYFSVSVSPFIESNRLAHINEYRFK